MGHSELLRATRIADLHDRATEAWHHASAAAPVGDWQLDALVLDQHRSNFDLWHWEDAARDPAATDTTIAAVKHAIDKVNQCRNDLAERVDLLLFNAVAQNDRAPLHSETPGLIIDRLSILALKLFHTAEQITRSGVDADHVARNRARLDILSAQRSDLVGCLDALWADVLAGDRRFKLYCQLKMYNDPTLNPVLYRGVVK